MTPDSVLDPITEPKTIQPPSTAGMTTRVVKGSAWTLVGAVTPLLATLISTPFVIRFLGSEAYGVLILVGMIPTLFAFADFGMGIASTKFGSEAYGNGDRVLEGEVVRVAVIIALATAFSIALPLFVLSFAIVTALGVPSHLLSSASTALKITAVAWILGIIGSVVNTPQLSRLRMELSTYIGAGARLLLSGLTVAVLYFGGGIVEAASASLFVAVLMLGAHLIVSGTLLREIYQTTFNRTLFKPMLVFGSGLLFSGIAGILLGNLEKLFLTRLVSVKSLAYYSVAFTFAYTATMFSGAMAQSLVPAFSQLLLPEKRGEFDRLFSRSFRLNIFWLLPALMFLFVIARPFFTIWAGEEFGREATYPFYFLLLGLLFNIVAFVPHSAITAFGRTDVLAKVYWIELGPYIVLAGFMIASFGIVGAAVAWSLRVIVDALVLILLVKKIVSVPFSFAGKFGYLILSAAILLPPILFSAFYDSFSFWLILLSPACAAGYAYCVWRFLISADEQTWLINKLSSLSGRVAE